MAILTRPAWQPSLPELVGDVRNATRCVPGPEFDVVVSHGIEQGGRGVLCRTKDGQEFLIALFESDDRRDGLATDHVSSYPLCHALRDTTPLPRHHWIVSADCGDDAAMERVKAAIGGERFSMPG